MRRDVACCVVGVLLFATAVLGAQSRERFEVAAIRRNKSGGDNSSASRLPGGRITITNNSLFDLVRQAYEVKAYQISGGPGWIRSDRFDIAAQADGDAGQDKLRSMMRALLE